MGGTNSKIENNEALRLCKERKRFIKQAIDSRYALAAAHICYIQSLKNVGVSLRRYAEAEALIESSLSTSATELDKTPSHSSYPSPCPSHTAEVSESPLHNGSPISPPLATINHMMAGGTTSLTVKVRPDSNSYVYEESVASPLRPPPPPPPPHESSSSWDYFDTNDEIESFRFLGTSGLDVNFDDEGGWRQFKGEVTDSKLVYSGKTWPNELREGVAKPESEQKACELSGSSCVLPMEHGNQMHSSGVTDRSSETARRRDEELNLKGLVNSSSSKVMLEQSGSRNKLESQKSLCTEQEDPSEFITHRAKDFISSIKDIEHRFFRASESGREISRMLEANKIRVGYLEANGRISAFAFLDPLRRLRLVCCPTKTALFSHEPHQTKVITWKRSTSSRSSSSRNPLAAASKDDADDSGSDFVEDFCMISGSHSSTLDRLYAWERKLYDEVKASESIRKEYDRKCDQLRYLFAKDYSTQVIDKTRAIVKDLHSRIRVAIYSVDSISKRIEKMRDEEMQPQLVELIQGLIRMWKAMLECHHAQYITISLAYHSKSSMGTPHGDAQRQIMAQLQQEIEYFGLSFANWINSLASYVSALNGWLQHCILQPQERSKSRRPFSPRRVVAPPIFVLCRDWLTGIKDLPSNELSNAIKAFLADLHCSMSQQAELQRKQKNNVEASNEESESKDEDENNDNISSNLGCIHSSLTKVLDRLTKFSEASLKMYEEIKQKSEAARTAYLNYKPGRY